MIGRTLTNVAVACVTAFFIAGPACGQDISDAQNKLLAKRAAEADAFRKLAETVNGVRVNSQTHVRDFVTESDVIQADLDSFVRGARLGHPRYYDDGVCEIDAEVTVAKLITTLKEIHTRHYKGNSIKGTDFEQIRQTIQKDIIKVTGMGDPRPDLPPGLPEGVEDVITQLPSQPTKLSVPAIWKTVAPQARLMAMRAARVDAMRRLLERIKGLRLTSDTLVRDFITEYDEISTRADGIVIGASEVRTYLHNDELIVDVTMEVPVSKVITTLQQLHASHYHGSRVTSTDITDVKKSIQKKVFRATGSGVPPPQFVQQAVQAGYRMPDWVSTSIRATGRGTDPAIDTPQGRLKAARAAELDAKRNLAEQVYGLRIDANTLVRDFVTEYDEVLAQVDAVLVGAAADPPVFEAGIAKVTVVLPAANVWRVVNQQSLIIRRR